MARRNRKQYAAQTAPLAIVPSVGGGEAARVRPDREYLAPFTVNPLANTLPAQTSDPHAPEITFDTFRRMMRDGAVSSAVNTLVRMTLADGMQLSPAFAGQQVGADHPENQKATEIADFVRRALETTRKPLASSLTKLLRGALVYGHKVAELTWKYGMGNDAGMLVLDRVACKPHALLDFALDEYSNHVGFIPRVYGAALPKGSRILPREKFVVLTLNEEDEDPRGESAIRPAYTPFLFKTHTWPEYLRWLQNCAQNALIAKLPPKQPGEIVRAGTTPANTKSEAESLLETVLSLKNASGAVVKNGTEFEQIQASSADGFETGLSVADSQISKAITGQSLASNEAQFGTRAQGETHLDLLDLYVAWLKDCLAEVVTADLVRKVVAYNYGEEFLPYAPLVSFGDSDRRDWSKDAAAASLLESSVTDSQWNAITTQIGLPAPLPGERPRREASQTKPSADKPPNVNGGAPDAKRAGRPRTGAFITLRSAA